MINIVAHLFLKVYNVCMENKNVQINHNLNLGQHFLTNEQTAINLVNFAQIDKNDTILEIGAGEGIVSKHIAKKCKELYIVEIDTSLKSILDINLKGIKNIHITYANALDISFKNYDKIVTSLPYNILEPFLQKCVREKVQSVTMLIGAKFANAIKNYNEKPLQEVSFTKLFAVCHYNCEVLCHVPKEHFSPPPRVHNYIVRLSKQDPLALSYPLYIFRELFSQGDKKIKNALIEALIRYNKNTQQTAYTQNMARQQIMSLEIEQSILEKSIYNLSNKELNILYKKICS